MNNDEIGELPFLPGMPVDDDILGLLPDEDEWYDSAKNEPTEEDWPEENGDEQCADKFARRDESQLVKPQPKSVVYDNWKV